MANPRGRPKKISTLRETEIPTLIQNQILLRGSWYGVFDYDRESDLDDWADLNRVLPGETSSESGQWVTDRFPFLRRPMKCLSPRSIAREIIIMKGAQLGFTETAINWLLYSSVEHPGPSMYVQKTDDAAMDFSNQKLKPSIEACAAVRHTLGAEKPKRYSNAWDNKAYPGGFIVLGGANSSAFLRSKSIRDAVLDEEDTYAANIDQEGSPVRLVAKRMVNFPDRKMARISTPVLEETSTIKPAYESGSQEEYYVPCPHCNPGGHREGFLFVLAWEHIKWSKTIDPRTGLPVDVWYECPHCAGRIDEGEHKGWMLAHGHWLSTKNLGGGDDPVEPYEVGDVEKPSFWISSLYSPPGFFSWRDAVEEWFEYQRTKDVTLLQVFINQTLAQTFTLEGNEIASSTLEARREAYAGNLDDWEIPAGVLVLTAGVDIQDDRIEVETVGWGLLEESWSVDYKVLPGDTAKMGNARGMLPDGQPSVWRLLDEYLVKRWKHEAGVEMFVECTMIDAGYKTEEAHTFCRLREARRVFPIKGKDGWGKGFWTATRRRHERYGTFTYTAFTDEIKNKIYALLQINKPGPGYCHFPKRSEYGERYFKGLTCENRRVRYVRGRKKLTWETPAGARNEPLDCRNYAYVAHVAYPVNLNARARMGLQRTFAKQGTSSGIVRRRRGSKGL